MIVQSFCAEDTYEIGKKIGQEAQPGQVICLYGDLGVGKTVFTKGLADGLGITEPIQSPTFTIVREYEEEGFHYIILMFIVLVILKRWTRSDMKIMFMEKESV